MRKSEVIIRCGTDEVHGIISQYYPEFQLLKINNIMVPITLIDQIELLGPDEPLSPVAHRLREPRTLHLVAQGGNSK
ncbi:hypothetical protein [Paenibacillus qinlingensis]|nr:hypothetical protein [Paenibacillus qinlingensis]